MGDFRKATDEAKGLFHELTVGMEGERKPMFGCPCLFLRGNMICGTYADRIFFRVPRDAQAAAIAAIQGARQFEPMAGRPMRDYLELDADEKHRAALAEQLTASWVRARELPTKAKTDKGGA